jgi:hypothetical protein
MLLATNRMKLHPAGGQPDPNFAEISGKHIVKLLFFLQVRWYDI